MREPRIAPHYCKKWEHWRSSKILVMRFGAFKATLISLSRRLSGATGTVLLFTGLFIIAEVAHARQSPLKGKRNLWLPSCGILLRAFESNRDVSPSKPTAPYKTRGCFGFMPAGLMKLRLTRTPAFQPQISLSSGPNVS